MQLGDDCKKLFWIYVVKITATPFLPLISELFAIITVFFARRSHETGNVHILHLASSCHLLPKEFDPITLPEVIQLEEVPVNSGHLGNLSICVLISLVTTLRWICFCFFFLGD